MTASDNRARVCGPGAGDQGRLEPLKARDMGLRAALVTGTGTR